MALKLKASTFAHSGCLARKERKGKRGVRFLRMHLPRGMSHLSSRIPILLVILWAFSFSSSDLCRNLLTCEDCSTLASTFSSLQSAIINSRDYQWILVVSHSSLITSQTRTRSQSLLSHWQFPSVLAPGRPFSPCSVYVIAWCPVPHSAHLLLWALPVPHLQLQWWEMLSQFLHWWKWLRLSVWLWDALHGIWIKFWMVLPCHSSSLSHTRGFVSLWQARFLLSFDFSVPHPVFP